ncbi:MAG: T9SS type A sorting domain-containing protein [Bacteroidetes bacterium]|nr:T9SS type A sorting domain-containing protein [Bacteroidota bacterium]
MLWDTDQKLSFHAFKDQVNCPGSAFPTDLQATPDCLGNVNFNWTNSGSSWYIDVSSDPNFGTFSNKDVSNLTSTSAPTGFSPSITFLPNITYYWRIWSGTSHTNGNSFICVSPTNMQVTADCLGNVNFDWTNSGNGWFIDVSTDANYSTFSNKDVSNLSSTTAPSGFSPSITFLPNTTYYWRIWNGTSHLDGNSFIFQPCIIPTNLQVFMGCFGDVAFNWSNSGSDWMVDVSSDPNFSFYYNTSVSNLTTITGPSGFACDIGFAPCTPGSLSFQPNVTYYWRIWNGTTHTSGNSFTVPATLAAPIITPSGATSFCQGGNVTLDAGSGYTTYSWSNGETTQTISVTSSDSYSVTITIGNGCLASSAITTILVDPLPGAPIITPNGTTTFCQGGSVILDAGAGYSTYSWNNGGTSQTIIVTSSNSYAVAITDVNGCSASSAITAVTVNPLPAQPVITQNGNILTSNYTTGNQWYFNDNILIGDTLQNLTITQVGNYRVTVTDANGCTSSSATLIIISTDLRSDFSSVEELDALLVYPNPNNGVFILKFNLLNIPLKITILNLLGEQVYFAYTTNSNGEFTINLPLSNTGIVSQGIYFIQVMAESKMYNMKVVCTE